MLLCCKWATIRKQKCMVAHYKTSLLVQARTDGHMDMDQTQLFGWAGLTPSTKVNCRRRNLKVLEKLHSQQLFMSSTGTWTGGKALAKLQGAADLKMTEAKMEVLDLSHLIPFPTLPQAHTKFNVNIIAGWPYTLWLITTWVQRCSLRTRGDCYIGLILCYPPSIASCSKLPCTIKVTVFYTVACPYSSIC